MPILDYTKQATTYGKKTFDVYTKGMGPDVIILPEIPGLHEAVFELGDRIASAGFRVHLLSLFGTPGKPFRFRDSVKEISKACIKKEFAVFASRRSSPICEWIKSYCTTLYQENQKGVGLIGMCLTGNFALSMLAEPWMLAPILSQPSLPFLPKSGLHAFPDEIDKAQKQGPPPILGLRFTWDLLCPKQRFTNLKKKFPQHFTAIEIDSSPGNPHRIPPIAHSVLTLDFVDQEGHPTKYAMNETLAFLNHNLRNDR